MLGKLVLTPTDRLVLACWGAMHSYTVFAGSSLPMHHMHAPYACTTCTYHMHIPYACTICMCQIMNASKLMQTLAPMQQLTFCFCASVKQLPQSLATLLCWLVLNKAVAAVAGPQWGPTGRVHLSLSCKAAAVEALHAAVSNPIHIKQMLGFTDMAQGFHHLVSGLDGNPGSQLTAGATLVALCSAEALLEKPEPLPRTIDAAGSNLKNVLMQGTLSLLVDVILDAVQVILQYCQLKLSTHSLTHSLFHSLASLASSCACL